MVTVGTVPTKILHYYYYYYETLPPEMSRTDTFYDFEIFAR